MPSLLGLTFITDLLQGSSWENTANGTFGVRPCLVKGFSGLLNPATILPSIVADLNCPPLYSKHPDTVNGNDAVLVAHSLKSIDRTTAHVWINLIYKTALNSITANAAGGGAWSMESDFEVSHIDTYVTAPDPNTKVKQNLFVWYKAGAPKTITTPPAGCFKVGGAAKKLRSDKVLVVSGAISGQAWLGVNGQPGWKTITENAADSINSVAWGSYSPYTWYFPGPKTRTEDFGNSFTIKLPFYYRREGWCAEIPYFNPQGDHPPDSTSEDAALLHLPAQGAMNTFNGITIASVQTVSPFNTVFGFTP